VTALRRACVTSAKISNDHVQDSRGQHTDSFPMNTVLLPHSCSTSMPNDLKCMQTKPHVCLALWHDLHLFCSSTPGCRCAQKARCTMRMTCTCSFFLANVARRASKKQKNTALLMPLDNARAPTPLHIQARLSMQCMCLLTKCHVGGWL